MPSAAMALKATDSGARPCVGCTVISIGRGPLLDTVIECVLVAPSGVANVAVTVFTPAASRTPAAWNTPLDSIAASTSLTINPELAGATSVPLTVTDSPASVAPSTGALMTTESGATVIGIALDVPDAPALSMAFAVTTKLPAGTSLQATA